MGGGGAAAPSRPAPLAHKTQGLGCSREVSTATGAVAGLGASGEEIGYTALPSEAPVLASPKEIEAATAAVSEQNVRYADRLAWLAALVWVPLAWRP